MIRYSFLTKSIKMTSRKKSPYFSASSSKKQKTGKPDSGPKRLAQEFFSAHSTADLAKSLLGKYLCRRVEGTLLKGIIVETEAYTGVDDHASFSYGGRRTEANEPMYMPAGTCFTKFTYGMYYCFNISSKDDGGAILLRAADPVEGIEKMAQLRRKHPKAPKDDHLTEKPHQLANGPSKLCIAFAIDATLNKANILEDPDLWLEDSGAVYSEDDIVEATRVGIPAKNPWADRLLRYYLSDFKSVSKK